MKKIEILKRMIREEVRKVRLKEERNDPTVDAYWKYLSTLPKEKLLSIAKSFQRIDSMDKSTPKSDLISHIITSEHGKDWTKPLRRVPEYIKQYIKVPKDKKLKESSFDTEVDDLATNLVDYLGTELPTTGWNRNPRIVNWFKENGIKINTPIAQDIYRRALELNQDNKPKSRKYLDN